MCARGIRVPLFLYSNLRFFNKKISAIKEWINCYSEIVATKMRKKVAAMRHCFSNNPIIVCIELTFKNTRMAQFVLVHIEGVFKRIFEKHKNCTLYFKFTLKYKIYE